MTVHPALYLITTPGAGDGSPKNFPINSKQRDKLSSLDRCPRIKCTWVSASRNRGSNIARFSEIFGQCCGLYNIKRNPSIGRCCERHQRADTQTIITEKLVNLITWTTALSNSMKLSHARGATQDGWVMVERSDRMWSTGEGNGKPLQYSCLENPVNSMKRQNDRILKEDLPRSVGAQYATRDQ